MSVKMKRVKVSAIPIFPEEPFWIPENAVPLGIDYNPPSRHGGVVVPPLALRYLIEVKET